ncbi:MAG: universal stress protein [Ferruginibacter sp.]|nr:universal stress protein [Ferruginibacter sp.]
MVLCSWLNGTFKFKKMKTILVATDFSPAAGNAANYAADMALGCNAILCLLHVYQMPVMFSEVPLPVTVDEMREDAIKQLTTIKESLLQRTAGKLYIEIMVRMGTFFSELKTVCDTIKPYNVVMGSQGTTAAERLVFGSHTVYAMKHLMWPLTTVPPGVTFSSVKKIGLACDFDKAIERIPFDEIKILVDDFKAELHVLNTGKEGEFNTEIVGDSRLLRQKLAPVIPHYEFIANRDTDEGIIDFAEKNHIDLLIVLPKGHALTEKIMHKSHTRQLALHSPVPVMALHS